MPAIPSPLPLTVDDLPQVVDYLGNQHHRNHRGYAIQPPVGFNVSSSETFTEIVTDAIDVINGPRSGKERITVAAYWYVFSFKKGSYITESEWISYERLVLGVLGSDRPFVMSRHEHKRSGAADLNVLDPELRMEPFPHLDRPRTINRLFRLRHASDRWASIANHARETAGKQLIPAVDPIADSATTSLARLVRLLGKHIPDHIATFGRQQLPVALRAAGFRDGDWEISIADRLSLYRWPNAPTKKKHSRPVRMRLQEVVNWLQLFLLRRPVKFKSAIRRKEATKTREHAKPTLRTDPDVLPPANEPAI